MHPGQTVDFPPGRDGCVTSSPQLATALTRGVGHSQKTRGALACDNLTNVTLQSQAIKDSRCRHLAKQYVLLAELPVVCFPTTRAKSVRQHPDSCKRPERQARSHSSRLVQDQALSRDSELSEHQLRGQGDDREHTLRPEPLRHSHP